MYNLRVYEWDEAKRIANLQKHGLDFADAYLVYENPNKLTLSAKYSNERRWQDVANVEIAQSGMLALIYTIRDYSVRVVSFRPASRKERNAYETDKIRPSN